MSQKERQADKIINTIYGLQADRKELEEKENKTVADIEKIAEIDDLLYQLETALKWNAQKQRRRK